MSDAANSFDQIAGVYDLLAGSVFGSSYKLSQMHFLKEVASARNILIIGGGTGWILYELLNLNQTAQVWYVDASEKMLAKAKNKCRSFSGERVKYIHGTEKDLPSIPMFDAVIANFYFDMFKVDKLYEVIKLVKLSMKSQSTLIVTDFVDHGKWWQGSMLAVMYAFFQTLANLEAHSLPQWQSLLALAEFQVTSTAKFYGGFIESVKYFKAI